jgi:hypothetical protein
MSFILKAAHDDLQVNAWNWRPTLELLLAEGAITGEQHELLGANGCGGRVDADTAVHMADVIDRRLTSTQMQPDQRMLADLTVGPRRRVPIVFSPNDSAASIDANDLYSASYDWLVAFRDFCRLSGGFEVS